MDSLRDWVADVFFPEEFFYATLATLDRGKLSEGEVIQGINLFSYLIHTYITYFFKKIRGVDTGRGPGGHGSTSFFTLM